MQIQLRLPQSAVVVVVAAVAGDLPLINCFAHDPGQQTVSENI